MKSLRVAAFLALSAIAPLTTSSAQVAPTTYRIVDQRIDDTSVLLNGKRKGIFEVEGTMTVLRNLNRPTPVDLGRFLDWDITLTVSESDFVEGVLEIPLDPRISTRVIAEADILRISTSREGGPPYGLLEFYDGDDYWAVFGDEFEQPNIAFQVNGVVGTSRVVSSGIFAVAVPEPSGIRIIGFGGLLMLAKRRKR